MRARRPGVILKRSGLAYSPRVHRQLEAASSPVTDQEPQRVLAGTWGNYRELTLPAPSTEAMPGVPWGRYDELMTPAFWRVRLWVDRADDVFEPRPLGSTLREEVAACLLGGFGISAEVAAAAYERVRSSDMLGGSPCAASIEACLAEPLLLGERYVRYRFPRQRARLLSAALPRVDGVPTSCDDRTFRDRLTLLPGVGPKTASWITRNWRRSDQVAVIDVHILRACELAGVVPRGTNPTRDYTRLEARFLELAHAIGARPSVLDGMMWAFMRSFPRRLLRHSHVADANEATHR